MATRISTSVRNAQANAVTTLVDAGAGPGTLKIYTGSQPATPDTAPSGTLLATHALADPSFGSAATGVITLDTTPALSATGVANGTAGWFRVADSAGAAVFDGSVTASGGGGDLELASTTISTGATVEITAGTYTVPVG